MAEITALQEWNDDMTGLAEAIRAKSGGTGKLGVKAMKVAVESISVGSEVKRTTGSFTTHKTMGTATINCGFQPDLIYVYTLTYEDFEEGFSIPFGEQNNKTKQYCALGYWANGIYEVRASKNSFGFAVTMYDLGYGAAHNLVLNRTFNYVAVKYS